MEGQLLAGIPGRICITGSGQHPPKLQASSKHAPCTRSALVSRKGGDTVGGQNIGEEHDMGLSGQRQGRKGLPGQSPGPRMHAACMKLMGCEMCDMGAV